jgi:ribosome-associated toxin RatA of RatAB toxin-antitoxin module
MGVAKAFTLVPLPPDEAFELWTDVRRWPTFVDGFAHPDRTDPSWPQEGAKLVWKSVPGGRGLVTERVIASTPATLFETVVLEEKLDGTQTVAFAPIEDGTRVDMQLDYKVHVGGPLRPLIDVLFIRRAQNEALARTLRRFTTEATEQSAL